VSVVLFEILLSSVPTRLEEYLLHCLAKVLSEGAQFSWLAFDGAFDFDHLFTDDVVEQIYGFQFPDEAPRLSLEDVQLTSLEWRATIRKVRNRIVRNPLGDEPGPPNA